MQILTRGQRKLCQKTRLVTNELPLYDDILVGASTRTPLESYPWSHTVGNLVNWARGYGDDYALGFSFDFLLSLAYIDTLGHFGNKIEFCPNAPEGFNSHLGFINLCSCCYRYQNKWQFQKASKPQSGVIGKITSEVILAFMALIHDSIEELAVIGGVDAMDAVIKRSNGDVIVAEIKASPLLTYPLLAKIDALGLTPHNGRLSLTRSQADFCETGLYMHNGIVVPLGRPNSPLWPFEKGVAWVTDATNQEQVHACVETWKSAVEAYKNKSRGDNIFYLTNACGKPPRSAAIRDGWPPKESVSDSKTSAGMDRTDDIKKGIYQTFKIGTYLNAKRPVKTAIISNLPALRHSEDYVDPFVETFWAYEKDFIVKDGTAEIQTNSLHRPFDYLITLVDPLLRGENL